MSDKPKFSLLAHLKEKQNVESPKPTQAITPSASDIQAFRPAASGGIPRFKPAGQASANTGVSGGASSIKAVADNAETREIVSDESKENRPAVSSGVSTAVARTASVGGLTHQLEAMKLRAEAGKKSLEALYITEHQPFNELLERLDSLFDDSLQLDDFNVQPARDIVERIMLQLKEDPNLDGMMIDKDAANIIAFVRKVKGVALDAAVQKKEKAEKTASNKTKKSGARFDADALEGLNFSVPVKKSIAAPTDLADVANIDLDKLKF